jgi:ribosomal protein S18 acetylase RimI-like enzyme
MATHYETHDKDELDLVRPLWEKLNRFHADKSRHFKKFFEENSFDKRAEKFLRPHMRVRIDTAVDTNTGEIIGYSLCTVSDFKEGEIHSIFVEEEHRGRGIGHHLASRQLLWLEEEGAENVSTTAIVGNEEAFAFYEKFGLLPASTVLIRR